MTTRPGPGLIHVVGRAQPGDPVTATARALCHAVGLLGHPGRLVTATASARAPDVATLADAVETTAIVHTVDGGEALMEAVPALLRRRITVLHHGSMTGSDRRTLRALRGCAARAVAADAAAREELRGLGFTDVRTLDPRAIDGSLGGGAADPATAENLRRHPGPMILAVGQLGPNRSLEVLLDAFARLVTTARPSATLSVCGPSSPWYLASLRRRIQARGLVACDLVDPSSEGEVVARLDRADVLVTLRPSAMDPYTRGAARRGVPVVAPLDARTAALAPHDLVRVTSPVSVSELSAALHEATAPRTSPGRRTEPAGATLVDGATIVRTLAIR